MRSKEKITKEIVLIRYYNVLFYLFFEIGLDDFKKQCLVSWVASAESMRMKQIKEWCYLRLNLFIEKISHLELIYGISIHTVDLDMKSESKSLLCLLRDEKWSIAYSSVH